MNREFKFRVWDSNSERFLPISEDSDYLISPSEVGLILIDNGSSVDSNRLIWLQFTGLLDKNDKEIYEGDVVIKHYDQDMFKNREPKIGVIKWVDFGARFTHEGVGTFKHYDEIYENKTDKNYARSPFEVIGNVFENPELFKLQTL